MEKLVHSTETLPMITINGGRQIVIGNVRPNVNLVKVTKKYSLKIHIFRKLPSYLRTFKIGYNDHGYSRIQKRTKNLVL